MAAEGVPATGATAFAVAIAAVGPTPRNTVLELELMMRYWPVAWASSLASTSAWTPVGATAAAGMTTVLPSGANAICEFVDISDFFQLFVSWFCKRRVVPYRDVSPFAVKIILQIDASGQIKRCQFWIN
jgi:hypothetical protein